MLLNGRLRFGNFEENVLEQLHRAEARGPCCKVVIAFNVLDEDQITLSFVFHKKSMALHR